MKANEDPRRASLVFAPFLIWLVVGAVVSLLLPHVMPPHWYASPEGVHVRKIIAATHGGGTILLFLLGMLLVLRRR